MSAPVCACVGISLHPRSTAIQTESGYKVESTQEIGHLLLWLSGLDAKVQSSTGGGGGGGGGRLQKCMQKKVIANKNPDVIYL